MTLNVHALTFGSRSNGPGLRHVVHTRGCDLGCPGCFNTETHPAEGGTPWEIEALAQALLARPADGISISGGEPFQQLPALTALLTALRAARPDLSLLCFSGYTREEITALPGGIAALALLDVLVDGRFDAKQMAAEGLRGSANQRVHLLTPRHTPAELEARTTEILIHKDGTLTMTGFPTAKLVRELRRG